MGLKDTKGTRWLKEYFSAFGGALRLVGRLLKAWFAELTAPERWTYAATLITTIALGVGLGHQVAQARIEVHFPPMPDTQPLVSIVPPEPIDFTRMSREFPKRFAINSHHPGSGEGHNSGSVEDVSFDAAEDLVRVEDDRVWWESDNDDHTHDTEDDHLMHWAMEIPFRRTVEQVCAEGGTLKVQDAYRAEGVHAQRSLHKQGRGMDLTCKNLPLSRLAKICWAAGFDWVYYETSGGHHIHVSAHPKGKRRISLPFAL